MNSNVRNIILIAVLSLISIVTATSVAFAQNGDEPTGFKNVQLWIYPEYDDPRLLVMLEGQIDGISPPAAVRFLVPATAEMYSAGSMDLQGQYSGGPPQREPSSIPGWDEISYEVTTDTFRVEYYDPIIIGHPDKTISYEFHWLYPISSLDVIVQEPRASSGFTVTPTGQTFTNNGFTAYSYHYSGLDDESPLRFEIAYTRSETKPSLSVEASGSSNNSGTPGSITTLIIVAAVVIFFIFGGYFWIRRSQPKTRAAQRRLYKTTGESSPRKNRTVTRFCTQCGEQLENSSRFCPNCGMKR